MSGCVNSSHDCGYRPTIEHSVQVLRGEVENDAPLHPTDEVLSSITVVLAELHRLLGATS